MSIGIIVMGFLVGSLVGLTGVGGAALLTPVLILLGINPSIAVEQTLSIIQSRNFSVPFSIGDKRPLISN